MTAETALAAARPAAAPPWARLVLAIAAATAGLVGLALVFAGTPTYEAIARESGFERNAFHVPARGDPPRREVRYDVPALVELHAWTLRYVLEGRLAVALPRDPTFSDPLFTEDEQAHLDDVSVVFGAARVAALAALGVFAGIVAATSRGGWVVSLRAARDAVALAALLVAAIGGLAAVAFEPAFLAFHRLFFPQGNFLFDPATSNLLALYPDPYWYGVTLRIGAAFVGLAGAVALAATLALRVRTAR